MEERRRSSRQKRDTILRAVAQLTEQLGRWPSHAEIRAHTGLIKGTLSYHLKLLADAGWVRLHPHAVQLLRTLPAPSSPEHS